MALTEVLLQEAARTYDVTENLFHRVTDADLSWAPASGTNWMTVGQLMMHCACYSCGKAVRGFVHGDWGLPGEKKPEEMRSEEHVPPGQALPSVTSTAQALNLLRSDRSLTMECIAEAGEDALLARQVTPPWGGQERTLFQNLLEMIAHLAQHKGQLFYYLKLMGRDVNTTDLWGG